VAAGYGLVLPAVRHSLHGYFRPGPGVPQRTHHVPGGDIRDGRSFSVRSVGSGSGTRQDDLLLLCRALLSLSPRGGPGPPRLRPPSDACALSFAPSSARHHRPDRSWPATLRRLGVWSPDPAPDRRCVPGEPGCVWRRPTGRRRRTSGPWIGSTASARDRCCIRLRPDLRVCNLTRLRSPVYDSCSPARRGGCRAALVAAAGLDHAVWFHRPFRADEWFLYDCWSPSAVGGPGAGHRPDVPLDGATSHRRADGLLRRSVDRERKGFPT